jgi:hypothetical protein
MSPCDCFVEHMFLSYLRAHHEHLRTSFACGPFRLETKSLLSTQRGVSMLYAICLVPMPRPSNA